MNRSDLAELMKLAWMKMMVPLRHSSPDLTVEPQFRIII